MFTIQARNNAGEKLTRGGDAFDVEVLGPDDSPVEVRVCVIIMISFIYLLTCYK